MRHKSSLIVRLARLAAVPAVLGLLGVAPAGPSADLNVRARKIAEQKVKELGEGYTSEIDRHRHLIYISVLDDSHLRETMELMRDFHDAYRRTMGDFEMPWNITVILPTVADFRERVEGGYAGMYYHRGRKIISLDRGQVLLHEFTHALHDAHVEAAAQPLWVREGLATLFESSDITPGGLEPYVDESVYTVQEAILRERSIPLGDFFRRDEHWFVERTHLAYAQSHYLFYYLHERDRLKNFWRRLQDAPPDNPAGVRAFERALPGDIECIDEEWRRWVLELEPAEGLHLRRLAMLGVRVEQGEGGAEITELVHDGPADRAGRLRVGDVIVAFSRYAVESPEDLYDALRRLRAMQTVEIRIIRHSRPHTVRQALGAPKLRR